jgi:F-type H+-transporting ATPase subunit alpha
LKQGQYSPVPVEKQVVSIYYGTKGFLETISVKDVKRFEKEVLEYIEINYKDVLEKIRTEKVLTDEVVEQLNKIGEEFLGKFKRSED